MSGRYEQPAAPEPSADTVPESMHAELRQVMLSERRAKESAEAQLAAVAKKLDALIESVRTDYISIIHTDDDSMVDALDPEEVEDDLKAIRSLLTTAPGPVVTEPHWLTKDFNALYRAARELLRAIDGHWLDQRAEGARIGLSGQLTRLQPAFDETEAARAELAGRVP